MKYMASFVVAVLFLSYSIAFPGSDENRRLSPIALKTKEIVEAAHDFVLEHSGDMAFVQKAFRNDPRFIDHDRMLYIFMHFYDASKKIAVCCGQGIRPEFVGKNMWYLRTPNGRLLFHEFEQIVERDGEGWIEYEWLNPYTKTIQTKRSFLKGVVLKDGRKAWIGCGYWKE